MKRQEVSSLRYEFKSPQEMNHYLMFIDFLVILEMIPYCPCLVDPYELTVTHDETAVDV